MALTQVQPGMLASDSQYTGFKNRIINGAMPVSQYYGSTDTAVTASVQYMIDRWRSIEITDGAMSVQQSTTSTAGFNNSMKFTVTTADASLSAGQLCGFNQFIEGYNTADLGWGTANASTVTLSFWVRSSLTGTFAGAFRNSAENRGYIFTYTINSANTFEYKTITVAGDTSGTWDKTNGAGIDVIFSLGTGTTYQGTAGSWQASNAFNTSGAVSVIGTLNATFYITGVQLEKGSTATSFDYRPYGTELQLCMRYYEKTYEIGTVPGTATSLGVATSGGGSTGSTTSFIGGNGQRFTVPKRTAPTVTVYDLAGNSGVCQRWQLGVSNVNNQNWVTDTPSATAFSGYSGSGSNTSGVNYHYTASAEL